MKALPKIGAVFFVLWGLVHILGGLSIMTAAMKDPSAGYGFYIAPPSTYPAVAGAALAYLAYGFAWIGLLVAIIGATLNWRNDGVGLFINAALVGFTDLGLVVFFLAPGYVGWDQGAVGLSLFAAALVFSAAGKLRKGRG